jgi:hypothetical protein
MHDLVRAKEQQPPGDRVHHDATFTPDVVEPAIFLFAQPLRLDETQRVPGSGREMPIHGLATPLRVEQAPAPGVDHHMVRPRTHAVTIGYVVSPSLDRGPISLGQNDVARAVRIV